MLKDILVHVDGSPQVGRRLDLALMLAERTEAHVIGLQVDGLEQEAVWADAYGAPLWQSKFAEQAEKEAEAARARFACAVAGRAVTSEWRTVRGFTDQTIAEHACYADLVVLGQTDPAHLPYGSAARLPEDVPLASGKPCLIVPYRGDFPSLGERVLVAWNGSREASRAVTDALPLLRHARQVTVVEVGAAGSADEVSLGAADLAAHLARHGIEAQVRRDAANGQSVIELLLALAAELSVDLMVMGSYGHARLRELILGGVTRGILARMTVPVLMSH